MRWPRRLRALLRGRAVEREIDEELRFHVYMDAAERVRSGAPAGAARVEPMAVMRGE